MVISVGKIDIDNEEISQIRGTILYEKKKCSRVYFLEFVLFQASEKITISRTYNNLVFMKVWRQIMKLHFHYDTMGVI